MDIQREVNDISSGESGRENIAVTPVKPRNDQRIPDLAVVSTPEDIEKAFTVFGNLLSRRKTELSEMKRANQCRLNDEVKFRTTEFSASESRVHSVSEALVMTADLSYTNTTPSVRKISLKSNSARQSRSKAGVPSSTGTDGAQFTHPKTIDKDDDMVHRIAYDKAPLNPPTTPFTTTSEEHTTHSATSATTTHSSFPSTSSSAVIKESVYHEMVQQLKGEKMRVTELSAKINELHGLEEEQRQRARLLADEGDRLRSSLDTSEEEVSTLREMCKKQMEQIEHKSNRIIDLERTLGEYLSRESDLREEIDMAGQLAEAANKERDRYMKGMDEAVESLSSLMLEVQRIEEKYKMLQQHCEELESNSVSVSNEQYEERITTLQREFDEMSASNQNLLHQHTSMTIKINQGQEALQRAKDELDTAECDKEMLQAQFEEMSRANEILIAKNNKLQADIRASEAAEIRANEEATVFERAARSAEAIAKQHLAAVRDMEKVVNEIEADRLVHVSAHGSLLRLVDKEKVKNIEDSAGHQFQVVVLLLLIWVLMLGLIYEVNIDLRPSTHDAVRITY